MFRNITKRERFLALATISAALAALVYNFVIEPIAGQWSELDRKIRDKEVVLRKYSRILRDKDNIEKQRTEYAKYFKSQKLTPEEESAVALSRIERSAHAAKVRITNIKPLSYKSFEYYNESTFRVATESTLAELTKFIYDLQSSDQLLKVERMVLRAKENEPAVVKSILNITRISVF
ncbi:MAG: hypothetical protein V1883_04445 [Candidatus Omnitrophota bacterium]